MKTLFNNKGISLIILIVAMTLIAILGVSFVSFMGSKQKGFVYQVDSYRSLNVANAGVEYAIRYVSDGLSDATNPGNTFFNNPSALVTRNFGGGTFAFTYDHASNRISVTANYPNPSPVSKRDIRLSNFRRYLNPISLRPDGLLASIPQISGNDVIIPTISNNESSYTITRIDVSLNASSNIYLNIFRDGTPTPIFNNSGLVPYTPCLSTPNPICYDPSNGIYIGVGSNTFQFDLSSPYPNHLPDSLHTYTLHFSAPPPVGQYTLRFYTSLPAGNPYTIRFLLP